MADFDEPRCAHGEYHGFNEGYVSTVYFWCPIIEEHACRNYDVVHHPKPCEYYEEGTPKKFDKRGNELGGSND